MVSPMHCNDDDVTATSQVPQLPVESGLGNLKNLHPAKSSARVAKTLTGDHHHMIMS